MGMQTFERSEIFNVTAAGTQTSTEMEFPEGAELGIVVSHPGGGTQTTYTMEVCNNNSKDSNAGIAVWAPYPLFDMVTGAVLAQKTSAEDFPIVVKPPFGRARLKAVTVAGAGNIRAWARAIPAVR